MKYIFLLSAVLVAACGGGDSGATSPRTKTASIETIAKEDYDALLERLNAVEKELSALKSAKETFDETKGDLTSRADAIESEIENASGRLDNVDLALGLYDATLSALKTSTATLAATDTTLRMLLAAQAITLSTHGTDISALAANVIALGNENSALAAMVEGANRQLWIYDAGGVKRHKVLSFTDIGVMVELSSTLRTEYRLGSYSGAPVARYVHPNSLNIYGTYFPANNCAGNAIIETNHANGANSGAGYLYQTTNQPGVLHALHATAPAVTVSNLVSESDASEDNGGNLVISCSNRLAFTKTGRVAQEISAATYTYPAPITVGP